MFAHISGRIGELKVKVGSLVGDGGATELVTIQQLDPMGLDFRPPARYLPLATALLAQGLKVELTVEGDRKHPHLGKAIFIDNVVDNTTSTFLMRAEVPNPDGSLLPGLYIRAGMIIGEYVDAVVVPEQSVIEGQEGSRVFVVDADNTVRVVRVNPVDVYQGLRVLESGLESGQKVIVEGIQLVRPGQKVEPVDAPLENYIRAETAISNIDQRFTSKVSRLPGMEPEPSKPPPSPDTKGASPDPQGQDGPTILAAARKPRETRSGILGRAREEGEVRQTMVNFFIGRPIFATVLALLMLLVGGICLLILPISQYPQITPAQVQVTTTYTGADARTVAETVTTPIEQQINGVKGVIYFSSDSTSNGVSNIVATFDVGYSQDIGAVDIQNRVQTAEAVAAPGGQAVRRDHQEDLDGHGLRGQPGLARRPIRLDLPGQLRADLRPRRPEADRRGERRQRVRAEVCHADLARPGSPGRPAHHAGRDRHGHPGGEPPGGRGQDRRPAGAAGAGLRIPDPDQGAAVERRGIPRRSSSGGGTTARSSGSATSPGSSSTRRTTRPPAGSAARPPGRCRSTSIPTPTPWRSSNGSTRAWTVSPGTFPPGLEYRIAYDTTKYVNENIIEVQETLYEALLLVLLVVFVFLQGVRATLIPMLAIPVSLVATFAMMAAFGLSINTLTLCGLVLAIGLVVDDAIIVVENVEKFLERGERPLQAVRAAMAEITAPIVTITLVLAAVFVPVAFIPGLTGKLYNQFALTIVFAFVLSAINSLTFSPAMSRLFLRPKHGEAKFILFRWFNQGMRWLENSYDAFLEFTAHHWWTIVIPSIALLALTYVMLVERPKAFIPTEDQGYLIAAIQTPDGTGREVTSRVAQSVSAIAMKLEGVSDVVLLDGFNVLNSTNQTNSAVAFVTLKEWSERRTPELRAMRWPGSSRTRSPVR